MKIDRDQLICLVTRIINKGVQLAHHTYKEWSGGWFIGHAPESFVQVEIARALAGLYWVTLEQPIKYIKNPYDNTQPTTDEDSGGRVDIVCWDKTEDKKWMPEILIEIKRSWGQQDLNNDIKRLKRLLHDLRSVKFGVGVVISDSKAAKISPSGKNQTLETRFEETCKQSEADCYESDCFSDSAEVEGKTITWDIGVGCFFVFPEKEIQ